jgi:glycosyltransferase involved in cell wall biosynthesis
MLGSDQIVSVVVPVHNLQDTIDDFVNATLAVLRSTCRNHELILVDDGSTDDTVRKIKSRSLVDSNVRLLVLSRRYGHQIALTAGLEHAIGDYVVLMAASLQHPPELIPKLIARAQQECDVVYVAKHPDMKEPWLRRMVASMFFALAKRLTSFKVRRDVIDFLILSRRAVNSITQLKEHNRYMPMIYEYVGYSVGTIPFEEVVPKRTRPSRYSYRQKIHLAIDAIVSFSDRPLRYLAFACVLISLLLFVATLWIVIDKLVSHEVVEGWTSLMALQLLMFSLLFLFLAVFSEYISRILIESKQRPLYYIREEHGGTRFAIGGIVSAD